MEAPLSQAPVTSPDTPPERPLIVICHVAYGLQGFGLLIPPTLPLTFIAAVIVDYIKREDARGTVLESHFDWRIRTFWYGLLWFALGSITVWIGVGVVILVANYIWVMYRVIRGWLYLLDLKPMHPKVQ